MSDLNEDVVDISEPIETGSEDMITDVGTSSEEMASSISDDVLSDDLDDLGDEAIDDIPEDDFFDVPEDLPEENIEDIPEDNLADTSEDVSDEIVEEIPEDSLSENSEDISQETIDNIPEDVIDDEDEGIPDLASDNIPEDTQFEEPEDTSDGDPDEIPEDTFEETTYDSKNENQDQFTEPLREDSREGITEDIPEEDLISVDKSHFTDEALEAERRADKALAREEAEMQEKIETISKELDEADAEKDSGNLSADKPQEVPETNIGDLESENTWQGITEDIPEEDLIPVDKSHFTDEALDAERRADEALAREEAEMQEKIESISQDLDQEEGKTTPGEFADSSLREPPELINDEENDRNTSEMLDEASLSQNSALSDDDSDNLNVAPLQEETINQDSDTQPDYLSEEDYNRIRDDKINLFEDLRDHSARMDEIGNQELADEAKRDMQDVSKSLDDLLKERDSAREYRKGLLEEDYDQGEVKEFNSTLQERLDHTPSGEENAEGIKDGEWEGERGDSKFIHYDPEVKEILDRSGLTGIEYKDGIPDFSDVAKETVEIENMTDSRYNNFKQADEAVAIRWGDGSTARNVSYWREDNQYTWHERNDLKTCDLVPSAINSKFSHLGGVSEYKKANPEISAEDEFDEA